MILKLFSVLIPMFLIATGFLQTFIYLKLKKTFNNWPNVTARITYSRFLNQLDVDGRKMVEAIIAFEYTFRGKSYRSETPVLRGYDLFPDFDYEKNLTKKYQVGDLVNARVHPKVNSVAYLEVAPLSRLSTVLVPLMIFLSIGFIVALKLGYISEVYEYLRLQFELATYQPDRI
ncbi:DUF3592 domain-containing protein [Microbulbifer thermotolerans]|uniref:DUF3592 domain-containing protein n=1 Tax=Microbulbifer thermotolerans TaxID=252514 RepID=A0A143HQE1_MICTH|nr:DUF3592 domain-containing protein [Microbulbifer thermotolerans]AMX03898.1 hypothetical protein A3224_16055 [Microbulbifer thermotolerans]MCX2778581.1 DUF3592 domain-containing protein [Microbulbifer thermotolerans]MCX2782872.1 DUF3592 domain-containing protein [Microbulbifer thermotolerans]MCX2803910.1 DUF3592 domain-containing protein [Microbulbifer thermotolerans]MCX2833351.1 DUF3592 domain-containing protein [Microbulbifer thermotolerans]